MNWRAVGVSSSSRKNPPDPAWANRPNPACSYSSWSATTSTVSVSFVVSEGFNELYDLDTEETIEILGDDTKLMLFGFRFLKQVLFGENTIPLKQDAATKRLARYQEKVQRMEQEAVAKRVAEQDEMYDGTDD